MNLLVIEDDRKLNRMLCEILEKEGYTVKACTDGEEGAYYLQQNAYDLALVDWMLPGESGPDILRESRRKGIMTPVVMLTALTAVENKVTCLDAGADDYLTKPFNPLELVARVKTQLRRYTRYNQGGQPGGEAQEHDFRGLQISRATHKCVLFGEELPLTPLEFSILWYLCQHRGQVVSSEELFESVWGEKYMDSNNTVMSHIARLREKMHEPSRKPKFIKTVWGVGYTIE